MFETKVRLDWIDSFIGRTFHNQNPGLVANQTNKQSLESRLAQQGLMIGLEMQNQCLKLILVGKLNQKSIKLFKEFIEGILAQGHTNLIFDLINLRNLDGNGLAALVWVRNQIMGHGGHLTVSNLSSQVRATLLSTNFHYLVNLADYDYC